MPSKKSGFPSVVFVYHCDGTSYIPFLTVSLASAFQHHPSSRAHVSLVNVADYEVEILKGQFPQASFHTSSHQGAETLELAIASKPTFWSQALQHVGGADLVVALDADTIVTGHIPDCLPREFDIIFTHKDEAWPLNSGVLVARDATTLRSFTRLWEEKTGQIVSDPRRLELSRETAGAADQLAMLEIISDRWAEDHSWKKGATVSTQSGQLRLVGMPCEILNNTNSVGLELNETRIIHVKRWMQQMIMDDGAPNEVRHGFDSEVTFARWEQLFLETSREAVAQWMLKSATEAPWLEGLASEQVQARGILNSEMHAILTVARQLKCSTIVESGVARGQSTLILNKYEPQTTKISLEIENSADFEFAKSQSPASETQQYVVADSTRWLPSNLARFEGPVVVLIDGPKGPDALRLAEKLVRSDNDEAIQAIFIHDVHSQSRARENPIRSLISLTFDRVWFSDEPSWVSTFSYLDDASGHSPGKKDLWDLGSYGPTLAAVFPTARDRRILRLRSRLDAYLGIQSTRPKHILIRLIKRVLGQNLAALLFSTRTG